MSFGSKSLPNATPEQVKRWEAAHRGGCIMGGECSGALEQHHLKSGNLRMGHWWTVCLCQKHHAEAAKITKFRGNTWMMQRQDEILGYITPRIRERNKPNRKTTASTKTYPRPTGGFS